jgi:broad specificity phosphatase PhoE
MTHIILTRHGQTEWNRVERFRGQIDVPLNELGHRQAQAIAQALAVEAISAIYASPLQRAQDTARPLAERLGLPIQTLSGLLDINYGRWATLSLEEAAQRDPAMYALWRTQPHLAQPPEGETLNIVRARVVAALERVVAAHPAQTVALVGHQVVNKIMACAVLGLDNSHFWRIQQSNACINRFDAQPTPSGIYYDIALLNDTCHLAALNNQPGV